MPLIPQWIGGALEVEERFKRESANSGLIFRHWTSRLLPCCAEYLNGFAPTTVDFWWSGASKDFGRAQQSSREATE